MEESNPFSPGNTVDMPASANEAPNPETPGSSRMRAVAIALFLPFPSGLGLWSMGFTRRFRFWAVASTASFAMLTLGGIADLPTLAVVGFGALMLSMVAAFFETVFRKPVRLLPTSQVAVTVVAVFFTSLIGAAVYRRQVLEAFQLPSGSMMPSLQIGDHMWVSKLDRAFQRGDVVIFDYPLDRTVQYVKRIVGMPGETISSEDGRSILINGKPLVQRDIGGCDDRSDVTCHTYVESDGDSAYHVWTAGRFGFPARKIPEDAFFVVGDNRDNSNDSRVWGMVPRALIKGKAQFVLWSTRHPGRMGQQIGRDTAN